MTGSTGLSTTLFPAYAGVIPIDRLHRAMNNTFPRIRGGDPTTEAEVDNIAYLFPAYAGVILSGGQSMMQ